MANATREYGDLIVTVTSAYDWRWNDSGSGADRDASFWHPRPQGNLRALGSVCAVGHGDLNNQRGTLLVGEVPSKRPAGKGPAVMPPDDFDGLWNDRGSGAKNDGSFWRPRAPPGYVSLGDVAWGGHGKPNREQVWCVRADLATDGTFQASSVWDDRGSGADADASFWEIIPKAAGLGGAEEIPIVAGTFRYNGGYGPPDPSIARVPVLKVPKEILKFNSATPKVTKENIPDKGDVFEETPQGQVVLPFLAFYSATDRPSLDYIRDPFCSVSKTISWVVAERYPNDTGGMLTEELRIKTGVSKSETTNMQHQVGVSISGEYGIGLAKYSISLNYQFTYSKTNSYAEFIEVERVKKLEIKPHSVTVAFVKHVWIKGTRADGSKIAGEVSFDVNEEPYLSGCDL